ncbi:phosphate ABC transporter permease subunit PstC [Halobacteriovorax sp.]|uniref:phosphate ABC transporter permease subunit PstC n=1 Tax=Halobacteriovorax sp. TaxID=2020862 RepID=UPI003569B32B
MVRDIENVQNSFSTENNGNISKKKSFLTYGEQDKFAYFLLKLIASLVIILLLGMIAMLLNSSLPAIKEFGIGFAFNDNWNPVEDEFGALAFLFGTLVTSALAIMIAAPLSISVAVFINEILPTKLGKLISLFVEMIAAIPSIVFGLWGIFFLGPFVKDVLTPFLKSNFGFLPLFQGASFGIGILTASIILAIMITPTITSICREVLKTVPKIQKEAALALGATRFEMIKIALIKPSFSGLTGGVVLGLGRALGETMAVAMVIGNSPTITASLFSPAATMASVIANEYAEADSDLHLSAMCYIGLLLFLVTFIVNSFARAIVWKKQRKARG